LADRLFKFVASPAAIINMARGSFKFTPIAELNDPSELTPIMDRAAVRRSLSQIRESGLTEEQFAWLHCQEAVLDLLAPGEKVLTAPASLEEANRMLSIRAYDDLDFMERKLFSTIRTIRERVGILSLTERYDSLPMWAHYADLARGYVAVLEDLRRSFPGDRTGSLNVPKPVSYADRFLGMTFDPATQDRIFFSKLSDWSYEREWRVVTQLNACETPDGRLRLRNVGPGHLTEVICGWRVEPSDAAALREKLGRIDPGIRIVLARLEGGIVTLT
jgi:hypothetical protein